MNIYALNIQNWTNFEPILKLNQLISFQNAEGLFSIKKKNLYISELKYGFMYSTKIFEVLYVRFVHVTRSYIKPWYI